MKRADLNERLRRFEQLAQQQLADAIDNLEQAVALLEEINYHSEAAVLDSVCSELREQAKVAV